MIIDWNNTPVDKRIVLWRDLRKELSNLPQIDQLQQTANFFRSFPMGARSIDFYTPQTWPTPWEILIDSLFCKNTAALLIFHTLYVILADVEREKLHLHLIDDNQDRYLVVVFDNKYVINYYHGDIATLEKIKKDIKTVEIFTKEVTKIV
jgi:hypothetical protein